MTRIFFPLILEVVHWRCEMADEARVVVVYNKTIFFILEAGEYRAEYDFPTIKNPDHVEDVYGQLEKIFTPLARFDGLRRIMRMAVTSEHPTPVNVFIVTMKGFPYPLGSKYGGAFFTAVNLDRNEIAPFAKKIVERLRKNPPPELERFFNAASVL